MGNTLKGEYLSSWDDEDVKKWKRDAEARQQCMYLQFEGAQFHDITEFSDSLRITKICFAIYGPPSEDAEELENAYNSDQRAFATKIYEKIRETWKKAPVERFLLGFVFIFCKEQEKEYQVPLFRLLWEKTKGDDDVRYIDTACRVYKSAKDWKEQNCLPMMKYCFPERLYYTCNADGAYEFDPERQTVVGFGTSPACDLSARIARVADVVVTTVAVTVGVATIFTPVGFVSAPILLGVAGTSTGYGVSRAAQRLIDKLNHGESITDLEGALLMLSIVAAPLNMLSGFVSARLAAGAASGRIFSQSQRILATLLMFTAVGVDGFSFILNLSNLIHKLRNDSLTTVDVLQFSVNTLFFTNTLIQPKTAWGVIKRAQQQRITTIADNMTDAQAKKAFQSYLEQNKGDGSIKATSKIVRNLNRMEDPSYFFKSVKDMDSVKIAGRKGKTLYVTDNSGKTVQVNPNHRTAFSTRQQMGQPKIQNPTELRRCLGGDYENHRYLRNSTERDIGRMNKVFGAAAKYNRNIVAYAERLADGMGVTGPDRFMSLVEVVAAEVRDEFKALYHYRKHGEEFMEFCTPQYYLGDLPQELLRSAQPTKVCNVTSIAQDGSRELFTIKTLFTPDDKMIVLGEKNGRTTISTMYVKHGGWTEYMNRFRYTNTPPAAITLVQNAAHSSGIDVIAVQLMTNNNSDFWKNEKNRKMMAMLLAYHFDYGADSWSKLELDKDQD